MTISELSLLEIRDEVFRALFDKIFGYHNDEQQSTISQADHNVEFETIGMKTQPVTPRKVVEVR